MMTRNDAIAILNIMKIRTGIGTDDLDTTIRMEKEREAIDFAVDDMRALRALSVGWHRVEDDLPKKSGQYLTFQKNAAFICAFNVLNWRPNDQEWRGCEVGSVIKGVTHWMEIPMPVERSDVTYDD